jgi:hypothetical protein
MSAHVGEGIGHTILSLSALCFFTVVAIEQVTHFESVLSSIFVIYEFSIILSLPMSQYIALVIV